MKFEYQLDGIGWANVFIEIDGQELYFSPSYLSDSLGDLVNRLIQIIPGLVPDDELKKEIVFEWDAEPAICKWRLDIIDEKLKIKIDIYEDDVTKKFETKINTTCELNDFLKALIQAMDLLLKTHGFIGYKETWYHYDFPISSYLKLKKYLCNAKTQVTKKANKGGIEMSYSNLDDEIKLMS